jgi:hypothetical protein
MQVSVGVVILCRKIMTAIPTVVVILIPMRERPEA